MQGSPVITCAQVVSNLFIKVQLSQFVFFSVLLPHRCDLSRSSKYANYHVYLHECYGHVNMHLCTKNITSRKEIFLKSAMCKKSKVDKCLYCVQCKTINFCWILIGHTGSTQGLGSSLRVTVFLSYIHQRHNWWSFLICQSIARLRQRFRSSDF